MKIRMLKLLGPILLLGLLFLSACSLDNKLPRSETPVNSNPTNPVACTAEAKLCADGSAVGRSGPNCEFAPCPEENINKNTTTLKIYFGNSNFNPNAADCSRVYPLVRVLPETTGVAKAALQELFKGPTAAEKNQGYYSWFSEKTKSILKSVKIIDGTAYVDIKDIRQLIPNASTSCGSAEFLGELETTLREFPTIKKVVFAIDGEPATFYEWLQLGCPDKNCDASPFK